MSSAIAKIAKNKANSLGSLARELAIGAVQQHEEAVQYAADVLNSAIDDGGKEARKTLQVAYRAYPTDSGECTIVSIIDKTPGERERHWSEIMIATKQDKLAVTDDACATPVSFSTKAITIIEDADGVRYGSELWEKTTNKVVQ